MKCSEKKDTECICTYTSCSRHGKCCECVIYHRNMNEIPGCFFNKKDEKLYDRSVEFFIESKK